jgi:hypothetical protein
VTIPWDWIVHLVRQNQDFRKQLEERNLTEAADSVPHRDRRFISAFWDFWPYLSWDGAKDQPTTGLAEPLPLPEALDEAPHREKRFVAAFLPQFDARIWDWAKILFQGYQEATEVLTPLENDTWTADVVLQAVNLVNRKKREVKPQSFVSTMMDWLQLPLFRNQTLLTVAKVNHTTSESLPRNSTEGPTRSPGQAHRYSLENIFDFCIVAMVFIFAMMVAFAAGLAGKRARQNEEEIPIAVIQQWEQESWKDGDIIQDCENCDFHLEYPLVHLPENP